MRITGPNGPAAPAAGPAARRSASGSFVLPQETKAAPASPSGVRTVGGIEALIALQGVESAEERRRRAVARGRTALDALDELKLRLLSGDLDPGTLGKLQAVAAGLKGEASGDPGLDRVLAEIELRVEVELAKLQAAAAG
jgi:hypothetical protein